MVAALIISDFKQISVASRAVRHVGDTVISRNKHIHNALPVFARRRLDIQIHRHGESGMTVEKFIVLPRGFIERLNGRAIRKAQRAV